jgi:Ca2+-binding RTX toxin-like protein
LGGDGSDTLDGGAGDDIYDGGAGDDTLQAGAGADTYVLARGGGVDTVTVDYFPGEAIDTVSIAADISPAQVLVKAGGPGDYDLIISVIGDTAQMVLTQFLLNDPSVKPVQIKFADGTVWNAAWMARTATAITGTNSVDTLNGTDGGEQMFGLGGNDVLNGFGGNDTLDGGTGADKLVGGDGDDIYIVDNTGDTVIETANQGTDLVQSSVTYTLTTNVENLTLTGTAAINGTGNTLSNALTGNSANNTLSGGTGADTMIGGAGNDTYVVDNASDIVTENANEGTDLVQSSVTYMLGNNVENLTLTGTAANNGTGNELDNILTGNSAVNKLTGGVGNDTYVVDNTGDIVTENANEGIDLVQVNIATASGTYTLGSNVENATLTSTVAYNLIGNDSDNVLAGNAAANTLNGGAGNDTLNGGAGNDTMGGGIGNDTYLVDATGDVVTENANEGTDLIQVNIATAGGTYTLGSNVENAMLTNTVAYDLTGNALDNVLVGNAATNTLNGGAGNDIMAGGVGNDTMAGGTGNDTYILGRGYGADTVTENDATVGNTDVASFLSGIATDQIWFRHVGSDLEVSVIGTSDKLTIKSWYSGAAYHVEQFKTADNKTLLDTRVENLVTAMAAFAPPAAGQTTLPSNYQTALSPVIAANWQ